MTHRRAMMVAALLSGVVSASLFAQGGRRLTVTVFNQTPSGARVSGATVCLDGYPGKTTDGQGVVVFDNVADGSRSLAAWKSGFQRFTQPLLFNDRTPAQVSSTVLLLPGAGTAPACIVGYDARSLVPLTPDPPHITQFFVGGRENPDYLSATENIVLYAPFTGNMPTHFRVSESPTFAGAEWRQYQPEVAGVSGIGRYFGSSSGRKTVYFQYRAGDQPSSPVSAVVQDSVEIVTLAEHSMTDVATLIAHAEANGFLFKVIEGSAPESCPPFGVALPFRGELKAMFGGSEGKLGDGRIAYSLFSGRLLNPAWGLKAIDAALTKPEPYMAPLPTSTLETRLLSAGNPRDARATVRFVAKPLPGAIRGSLLGPSGICVTVSATLTRIVLTGPAGHDWREAFNRQ